MKIILLKDVPKVGRKYDIKDVADGFALNSLIPRGLAEMATAQAVKKVEMQKSADATEKKIQGELLAKSLETIKSLTLTLKGKANEKGHLFAGITKEMLVSEIQKVARLSIDPDSLVLAKPIKEIGEHKVTIEVTNKTATFTLVVEAQ